MTEALRSELEQIEGEVRFDTVSRALYSTDASVYQIEPLGVVVPRTREDVVRTVQIAARHRVSITARGGGTSQAGQAIGAGLQLDTSKYLNRVLEVNVAERWAWIEPGVVLDELNAQLRAARPALRARHLDRQPRDGRRHDRQQLERRAVGALRQDDRPRPRAARRAVRRIDGAFPAARCRGARTRVRRRRRSRPSCYRTVRQLAAACTRRDRSPLPESAAAGRRLQPRRVRRSGKAVQPVEDHRRVGGHAGSGGRGEGQAGAAAGGEGGADDRVRRSARRARRHAARPAPSSVGGRGDGSASSSTTRRRARRSTRCAAASCTASPGALLCVEMYGDRAEDLPPRLEALERELGGARATACRWRRAIARRPIRRASGASAKRRSACRWR